MRSILSDEAMKQMSEDNRPASRGDAIRGDHEEAAKRHSVELYLLNELREEDRARFEEHYFECVTCAEAVEAGQDFITQIRPVPASAKPFWRQPAAAIAALFLAVAGGQQFVIATLKAPQATTIIVAHALEKSAEERKPASPRTASVTIEVDLPSAPEYTYYLLTIHGGNNKKISQVVPVAANSEARLSILVPRNSLGAGKFSVDVAGLKSEDSKDGQKLDETFEFAMN
jgi:hypothetical protein